MKIQYYDQCVRIALQHKGIEGDTFKDTTLRVYERTTANPATLFNTLRKGGVVIPAVRAALLGGEGDDIVATYIFSARHDLRVMDVYVPWTDKMLQVSFSDLVASWESAGGMCVTAFQPDPATYRPKLIDLKYVELPAGFDELREAIAENAHDTWALERQSEGWTYGPKRDDVRLETPDMVHYADLTESEKQYDRIMAEDTLKLLIALGYKIERS